MSARKSVGVRELRQNLSVYLRQVEAGETLEVTERGRPVAVLGPLPERARLLDRLAADGQARRAVRAAGSLRVPVPPRKPLTMTASEALARLRADER